MLAHKGQREQTLKTIEELNELSAQIINTYHISIKRNHNDSLYDLACEVADVETMLIQMGIVFKFPVDVQSLDRKETYDVVFIGEQGTLITVAHINAAIGVIIDYLIGMRNSHEVQLVLGALALHISRIKMGIPTDIMFKARVAKATKFLGYVEAL